MKYPIPSFIEDCSQATYERWLRRKASAHAKRDAERLRTKISKESYRTLIHQAVQESGGVDYFTGEKLDWCLISEYDNADSKAHGRRYKKTFALLPTVDHDFTEDGAFTFRICSWRTNDSKNDLTLAEFQEVCRLVLARFASK